MSMVNNIFKSRLYCLVMAGGSGTRFWPESTLKRPKQYLNLVTNQSLLLDTLLRFEGSVEKNRRFIVTVKEQEVIARKCAQEKISEDGLIFEPSGRNTAPCIFLSLIKLLHLGANRNDVVAIVPSDHVILNRVGFQEVIKEATEMALSLKKIVTIGIAPNFPHTGYGYIQRGKVIEGGFEVHSFKEKPDFATAKKYLESGNYFWNAGMFVAQIDLLLKEFEKFAPDIYKFYDELKAQIENFDKLSVIYNKIVPDSIDYAIMEKSKDVVVIPAKFDWNDLGSWDALESVIDKREDNIIVKDSGHYLSNAKNNIIFAPTQFVSLINVDDLIVISNEKSLVVLPKKDSQKVKEIVSFLKSEKDLHHLL